MAIQGFGINGNKLFSNVAKPMQVNLNFVVDSTNGNGLGIRSLKSNGYVKNVFMHTSATPAAGSPNPASGYAMIQFNNSFNKYLGGFSGFVSPLTGSNLTSGLTVGVPYVIVSLGSTTAAQWVAAGVPIGVTPALGLAFFASQTSIAGGGAVKASGISTVDAVEIVGDPNQAISNANTTQNGGAIVIVQFLASTSSSVTTLIPTAPVNNSVCGMTFCFDGSSVTVDGL